MTTIHVHPVEDTIEHDTATVIPDCICGPMVCPQVEDDGSVRELVIHHSLCCGGEWIAGGDIE